MENRKRQIGDRVGSFEFCLRKMKKWGATVRSRKSI